MRIIQDFENRTYREMPIIGGFLFYIHEGNLSKLFPSLKT